MAKKENRAERSERFFPLGEKRPCGSGKAPSAWWLVTFLLMGVMPQAQADATTQVQQAVENHLRLMLEQQASRQGWQGMQLRYDISVQASAANLPPQ